MSRWQLFGKTTSLSQAHGRGPWQVLAQSRYKTASAIWSLWVESGHHRLVMSISAFDPKRTSLLPNLLRCSPGLFVRRGRRWPKDRLRDPIPGQDRFGQLSIHMRQHSLLKCEVDFTELYATAARALGR